MWLYIGTLSIFSPTPQMREREVQQQLGEAKSEREQAQLQTMEADRRRKDAERQLEVQWNLTLWSLYFTPPYCIRVPFNQYTFLWYMGLGSCILY